MTVDLDLLPLLLRIAKAAESERIARERLIACVEPMDGARKCAEYDTAREELDAALDALGELPR